MFPEWLSVHQAFGLGDRFGNLVAQDGRSTPALASHMLQLDQPGTFGDCRQPIGDLEQWLASPQHERCRPRIRATRRRRGSNGVLEGVGIDTYTGTEAIAAIDAHDGRVADGVSSSSHMGSERMDRRPWWTLRPEHVDQLVEAGAARPPHHERSEHPPLQRAQRDPTVRAIRLERSQHPQFH